MRNVGCGQRGIVREVEAETVGRDEAALLRHVSAEPVAQCGVQQVRRRMVGAQLPAPFDIDA